MFYSNAKNIFVLTLALVLVTLTACGSTTTAPKPTLGSLQIGVSGLPVGVNASITLTGPGNFSQTLTAAQTLSGLEPGSYTVVASNVTASSATFAATVSGSPVTVRAGATGTANVVYAAQTQPTPPTLATGSLQVNVSGLPSGVNASLSVTGPNGFSQTLSASKTLTGLALGSYAVTAASVTSGNTTYVGTVSGSPATVAATATAVVSAVYTAQAPGMGSLEVSVTGLPSGLDAKVSISGPNGFSQTLSSSKTLNGLVPGSYAISAVTVTSSGITYLASVSGSPATVSAGVTAKASVAYAAQVGSLQINVAGLPLGTKVSLTVIRPSGMTDVLNPVVGSVSDGDLPVGTYAVSAATVRLVAPVVDLVFDSVGVSAAQVKAGMTTTVTVNYVPRPGTTALWLPTFTGQLLGYEASKLGFGGNSQALPSMTLSTPAGGSNAAIAFDAQSHLWTLNSATNTLLEFMPQQLASSATPTPVKTIRSSAGSLSRPAALAFDSSGNLWVANLGNDTIVMFTAYQLAQVDNPIPGLVISANTTGFSPTLNGVSSLTFDKSGNLWVLNAASPETIVRFTPDQLMRSGTPIPAVILYPGLSAGSSLAFDSNGNLWVSDYGSSTLVMYTAAQLLPSSNASSPMPTVRLSSHNGSLSNPAGLAFDSSGDLWVANLGNNTLVEFTPDQLTASGSPDAMSTISGISNLSLGSIAFNPAPLNLPLSH
ncbi:MAG: NHL repeat-containing protein [Thermaceae bacterium]|nr:NHL repeat-containing protein [Thermaceae bacterium]